MMAVVAGAGRAATAATDETGSLRRARRLDAGCGFWRDQFAFAQFPRSTTDIQDTLDNAVFGAFEV